MCELSGICCSLTISSHSYFCPRPICRGHDCVHHHIYRTVDSPSGIHNKEFLFGSKPQVHFIQIKMIDPKMYLEVPKARFWSNVIMESFTHINISGLKIG